MIKKKSKPVQLPLRQRKKDNRAGRQAGRKISRQRWFEVCQFLDFKGTTFVSLKRERERERERGMWISANLWD